MRLPNKVAPGEPVKASEWNAVVDFLRSLVPQPSKGIRHIRTSGGVTSEVVFPTPPAPKAEACPLKCYSSGTTETPAISVKWGTICGRQPTGFSASATYSFEPAHSTGYIYAKATASLETLQWTSADIVDSDDAFLGNTATEAHQLLASYTVDAGVVSIQSTCGNVEFDYCDLSAA